MSKSCPQCGRQLQGEQVCACQQILPANAEQIAQRKINTSQMTLAKQVSFACKVITRACEWQTQSEEHMKAATSIRESEKKNKKTVILLKIFAPLIALFPAGYLTAMLMAAGLPLESDTAQDIFLIVLAAIMSVVAWCIPFNAKSYIQRAEEQERLAQEKSDAVDAVLDTYVEPLNLIPTKYWYPLAVEFIDEVFQTGRATTMPVALDKLEEQIHRWKMEEAMLQTLEAQMVQAEILRNIQKNQERVIFW